MKSFIIILSLCLSHIMVAQTEIKGTIIDAESETPIREVLIYAYELNKSVVTDNNGSFNLSTNDKSEIRVEISADGYKTQIITLSPSSTDTIKLAKNFIELQEVIITGDSNKSREKVSVAIETVKKNDNEGFHIQLFEIYLANILINSYYCNVVTLRNEKKTD